MSTLAKAFVVVILILSVFFVSSTVTVLSVQANWKEQHDTKAEELKTTRADLESTRQRTKEELEKKDKEIVKKQDEIDVLKVELATAQTALADLKRVDAERENLLKEFNASLATLTALVEQQTNLNNNLRDRESKASADLLEAMTKRDEALSESAKLQEDNATLVARIKQFAQELEAAQLELNSYKTQFGAVALAPEARAGLRELVGKVLEVHEMGPSATLALISLGTDDGLRKGDRLSVVRGGSRYIGDVIVDEVLLDQSVVKVIPEMVVQQLRKDDEVTTRFVRGGR